MGYQKVIGPINMCSSFHSGAKKVYSEVIGLEHEVT